MDYLTYTLLRYITSTSILVVLISYFAFIHWTLLGLFVLDKLKYFSQWRYVATQLVLEINALLTSLIVLFRVLNIFHL